MTTNVIPEEDLARAHKRFCRGVALALIAAMRETETDFEDIDKRLGNPIGSAQLKIMLFITGDTTEGRMLSDLAYAMNRTCELSVQAVIPRPIETEETDNDRS